MEQASQQSESLFAKEQAAGPNRRKTVIAIAKGSGAEDVIAAVLH